MQVPFPRGLCRPRPRPAGSLPRICLLLVEHPEVADEHRPDRIGMIVTECGTIPGTGEVLPVLVVSKAEPEACRGLAARAHRQPAGRRLRALCNLRPRHADPLQLCPLAGHVGSRIEAAFRYERSRDAEELKRLGAVDDDYRLFDPGGDEIGKSGPLKR